MWDHDKLTSTAECCFVWIMLLQLIFFANTLSLALASFYAGNIGSAKSSYSTLFKFYSVHQYLGEFL
jgi:hypothetical protein